MPCTGAADRVPHLANDICLMMGVREKECPDMTRHRVHTFTRAQLDLENLCGMRAEWIIVFGEYEQEWLNTVVKPFLVAAPMEEIRQAQDTGKPITSRPALWHVPHYTDLFLK